MVAHDFCVGFDVGRGGSIATQPTQIRDAAGLLAIATALQFGVYRQQIYRRACADQSGHGAENEPMVFSEEVFHVDGVDDAGKCGRIDEEATQYRLLGSEGRQFRIAHLPTAWRQKLHCALKCSIAFAPAAHFWQSRRRLFCPVSGRRQLRQ